MGLKLGFLTAVTVSVLFIGNVVSYDRPPKKKNIFVRRDIAADDSPEQVHISLAGENNMRISWITKTSGVATVEYGRSGGEYERNATGTTTSYKYVIYRSGEIHDVLIGPLEPNTVYYYRCGGSDSSPEFSFKTPPPLLPIKFAVVTQTEWTNSTLQHISQSNHDVLLLPGDLSYAGTIQPRWDSFGRLVQPHASQRPWMVTQGNHEVERIPLIHRTSFTAYNARWRMPYDLSGSTSNLYYSFDVAGKSVHIIMLGSNTDFDPNSDQLRWLRSDLAKVDRKMTPWVVALVHAPWYNSNEAHQGKNESLGMKKYMEELLYKARVDVVFAGHVHAYERFTRVYNDEADMCGPVYITIGDGGNREGLAKNYIDPKPDISIFREASFGHGELEVVNATHALWTWHKNDDPQSIITDSVWLTTLSSIPSCI